VKDTLQENLKVICYWKSLILALFIMQFMLRTNEIVYSQKDNRLCGHIETLSGFSIACLFNVCAVKYYHCKVTTQ